MSEDIVYSISKWNCDGPSAFEFKNCYGGFTYGEDIFLKTI